MQAPCVPTGGRVPQVGNPWSRGLQPMQPMQPMLPMKPMQPIQPRIKANAVTLTGPWVENPGGGRVHEVLAKFSGQRKPFITFYVFWTFFMGAILFIFPLPPPHSTHEHMNYTQNSIETRAKKLAGFKPREVKVTLLMFFLKFLFVSKQSYRIDYTWSWVSNISL